jgi:hypothetical protein
MMDLEQEELDRPEFAPTEIADDPVTGEPVKVRV